MSQHLFHDTNQNTKSEQSKHIVFLFVNFGFEAPANFTWKTYQMASNATTSTVDKPLPSCVRKRLLAILKLQHMLIETDAEFHRRLFELEREFNAKRQIIYTQRAAIINDEYEPVEEDFNVDFLPSDVIASALNATDDENASAPIKGIPNFWLETLNNSSMTGTFECDRPALKYLKDIQLDLSSDPDLSFTISFKFDPNPYFENALLTKTYLVDCKVDPREPFAYDGAQIYRSIGCEVKWKDGMDYTKNQHSFFRFFSPPCSDIEADIDPNTFDDITADFEMGLFLKERMIPKAVLYFLSNEFESDESDGDNSLASGDIADETVIEDGIIADGDLIDDVRLD